MRWRRLIESTRPTPRRPRGATSGVATRTTAQVTARRRPGSGGSSRGSSRPRSTPRHQGPRINWARVSAVALCLAMTGTLAWLAGGPWLRVQAVSFEGAEWTSRTDLESVTRPSLGRSALLVDTASLALEIGALPAMEGADVEFSLPGEIRIVLIEESAVAVWRTSAAQLLLASDGTVIGARSRDAVPRGSPADLPLIEDGRDGSHDLSAGDGIPQHELDAALALAALSGARLGSAATVVTVSVDATYGFILSSPQAGWSAAFGFYGLDPTDAPETVAARIESQASAIRTLFASRPEAQVAWVDARNPGKVYFRARG